MTIRQIRETSEYDERSQLWSLHGLVEPETETRSWKTSRRRMHDTISSHGLPPGPSHGQYPALSWVLSRPDKREMLEWLILFGVYRANVSWGPVFEVVVSYYYPRKLFGSHSKVLTCGTCMRRPFHTRYMCVRQGSIPSCLRTTLRLRHCSRLPNIWTHVSR